MAAGCTTGPIANVMQLAAADKALLIAPAVARIVELATLAPL